jgi:hypothetical protein
VFKNSATRESEKEGSPIYTTMDRERSTSGSSTERTEIQRLLMTVEQNETEARKEQEWKAQNLSFNVRYFPESHDNLMTLWEVPKVKLDDNKEISHMHKIHVFFLGLYMGQATLGRLKDAPWVKKQQHMLSCKGFKRLSNSHNRSRKKGTESPKHLSLCKQSSVVRVRCTIQQ